MTERDPYLDGIMKTVTKEMTEPTPRTDAFDLYDSKRIYELELSLARKEALLRECQDKLAGARNEDLYDRIERELEG